MSAVSGLLSEGRIDVKGLSSNGDAKFSLSTNVPSGTETSDAVTGTRQVCDVVGNCAQAGPVAGNKVDKGYPVITISSPASVEHKHCLAVRAKCYPQGGSVTS